MPMEQSKCTELNEASLSGGIFFKTKTSMGS